MVQEPVCTSVRRVRHFKSALKIVKNRFRTLSEICRLLVTGMRTGSASPAPTRTRPRLGRIAQLACRLPWQLSIHSEAEVRWPELVIGSALPGSKFLAG